MRRLGIVLCLAVIFAACSDKNNFVVKGKVLDGKGKMLFFQKLDIDQAVTLDSVKLGSNGNFKFSTERLEVPDFFLLKLSENNFITILGDTTEHIEIEASAENLTSSYIVSNSMGSSYIKTLNQRLSKVNMEVDSLVEAYISDSNVEHKESIKEELTRVIQEQKDFIGEFIFANPQSLASYYAVFQRFTDNSLVLDVLDKKDQTYFATVATSLNVMYPDAPRVKQLYNFVLGAKHEQKRSQLLSDFENLEVRNYPDIKQPNLKGDTVKLSSLEGKLILLSFWASWDKSSMAENRVLKKIYAKYKSKGLEIYQVSLDKSKILWEDAVEKSQLPWINVSDLQHPHSTPAMMYNIKKLPSNFIISKEGKIIGKDVFGNNLDEKLNELLKK